MSERLNVKDMGVESVELPHLLFDPERDVASEEWQALKEFKEIKTEQEDWRDVVDVVLAEKLAGRNPQISDAQKRGFVAFQNDRFKRLEQKVRAEVAELILLDIRYPFSGWNSFARNFNNVITHVGWEGVLELAAHEKILGHTPDMSEVEWERVDEVVKQALDTGNMDDFVRIVAAQKVLGRPVSVTSQQWEKINQFRRDLGQQGEWPWVARMIQAQAILGADEIVIPPGGGLQLVVEGKPSFEAGSQSLPSTRNF